MPRRSLAFKFTVFSILAVVGPAAAIAGSLILIGRRALTEAFFAQQSETAQRIATRISTHIENVCSVLSMASKEPGLAVLPRPRQEDALRRMLRWQPSFKEAFILNSSGQEAAKLVSRDNKFAPAALLSRRYRPEFLDAMLQGRAVVTEPFFGGDRLPYLFVSCPTYGKRGVLAAKVSLGDLWSLVKEIAREQGAVTYIVDKNGELLAHPDRERVLMHTSLEGFPIVQKFKQGLSGRDSFGTYEGDKGQKMMSVAESVPGLGWGVIIEMPQAKVFAALKIMQREVIKWTGVSILVILALALWRVRQIVKPLKMLDEGARKIAQGQLDLALDIRTGDELEGLAESFKRMAESLKQLEELRRDLISMIVHDLKSPLSAIMGGLEYLSENERAKVSETSRRVLALSRRSADDLLNMIQNLLDVAKMEEGKLKIRLEQKNLAEIMLESCESFRLSLEKDSKSLVKNFAPGLPPVPMDPQLIRRVVMNLLSNAVRHTLSNGRIELATRRSNGDVELIVKDDGEGISPEYREKIFDKFVQADRSPEAGGRGEGRKRVHLRSGTGLGLTFCKMAVELHGGNIRVESEPGKGSTFIVTLPVKGTLLTN